MVEKKTQGQEPPIRERGMIIPTGCGCDDVLGDSCGCDSDCETVCDPDVLNGILDCLCDIKDDVEKCEVILFNVGRAVFSPTFGLSEIKAEISSIERTLSNPTFGLSEIKSEVSAILGIVTVGTLNIRNLECNRDSVTTCGSEGVPIRTDSNGNVFANINRTFVGDFQGTIAVDALGTCGNEYDVSQVASYAFYIRNTGNESVAAILQLAPDDTNFFDVQRVVFFARDTVFLPSIENFPIPGVTVTGPEEVSAGFPIPAKKARICVNTSAGETTTVDIGFAAWK